MPVKPQFSVVLLKKIKAQSNITKLVQYNYFDLG